MVAEASLANLKSGLPSLEIAVSAGKDSGKARMNSNVKLADMQIIAYEMAMDDSLEPHKRINAMKTFAVLEERRRLNLGKANPAPVKSEPKRGKRSSGAMRPAFVEQQPEQA